MDDGGQHFKCGSGDLFKSVEDLRLTHNSKSIISGFAFISPHIQAEFIPRRAISLSPTFTFRILEYSGGSCLVYSFTKEAKASNGFKTRVLFTSSVSQS